MLEGVREGYVVPISPLLHQLGCRRAIKNHSEVLWKHRLFASVEYRNGAREPMIVISNWDFADPLVLYRCRWGIETLFECLKSRGFCMEETYMTDPKRRLNFLRIHLPKIDFRIRFSPFLKRRLALLP